MGNCRYVVSEMASFMKSMGLVGGGVVTLIGREPSREEARAAERLLTSLDHVGSSACEVIGGVVVGVLKLPREGVFGVASTGHGARP